MKHKYPVLISLSASKYTELDSDEELDHDNYVDAYIKSDDFKHLKMFLKSAGLVLDELEVVQNF